MLRLLAFCAVAVPLVIACQLAAGTRWAPYVGVVLVAVTLVASFRESRIERDLARWEKRQAARDNRLDQRTYEEVAAQEGHKWADGLRGLR